MEEKEQLLSSWNIISDYNDMKNTGDTRGYEKNKEPGPQKV